MTLLRLWPLGVAVAALCGALWLYIDHLQDQLSAARDALSVAESTLDAWERINDADISSGDSIADRSWLLNRAK